MVHVVTMQQARVHKLMMISCNTTLIKWILIWQFCTFVNFCTFIFF